MEIREVRVKIGERWYTVEVDESTGYPTSVTVEGQTYTVEIDNTVQSKSSYKSGSKSGQTSNASSTRPIHTNLSTDGIITSDGISISELLNISKPQPYKAPIVPGRNEKVTITKGSESRVLKYKKIEPFLEDGWTLVKQ